ncbi:MAG: type II toxin-antitoxin system HicB family antitoxin [Streptosporangiales bacterium]|nr:type II toxin-antitoxin system HicB family antitoxin [Streptosporangiales bacterium]
MAAMSYRVVVTREDGAWLADVPELEGAHTWAGNLPALDQAVREVIVLAEDMPDEVIPRLELDYEYHTGDDQVDVEAADLRRERARVARLERQVAAQTDLMARRLVSRGYSVRDAAALTGVSHQRVSQLAPRRGRGIRRRAQVDA